MSAPAIRALPALAVLLAACGTPPAETAPPSVVATVFPLADLTARLVPDGVAVETLLPPRASPATWEAAPAQIRALHRALGTVSVGAGLDAWVEEVLPADAGGAHLRITEGLELRAAEHAHGPGDEASGDPHVWLDPILVRDRVLPGLEAFLSGLFPEDGPGIRSRAAALADSLTALDGEIRALLEGAGGRRFVATHEAWGYFSERYGLQSVGSLYERPGDEPSARGLARLVGAARAAGITTVLSEPQLAETAAEALAAELGGDVTLVDPLGGPGLDGRESYFEMMRFNARAFRRALGGP